jgi:hypothetical protein
VWRGSAFYARRLEAQHSRSNYAKQAADYHHQRLRRENAIELSRKRFGFFLHGAV